MADISLGADAEQPRPIAAIDIGTNSVHMLVARVNDNGTFEPIAKEKEQVRLGSSGGDMKRLDDEAADRAIAALIRFSQVADISGADIRAVATSAVREAHNKDEFLARVKVEAGIDVEVISGFEEARLIHLGALQAVPVGDRQILLVDIGGGSTELLIGRGGQALAVRSLKLGAVRLTERFFRDRTYDRASVKLCKKHIRSSLTPFVRQAKALDFEVAIGCSGTIEALARLIESDRGESPAQTLNNFRFTAAELQTVVRRLSDAPDAEALRAMPGIDVRRADILVAGGLIASETAKALGVEEFIVADAALREGVLLDTVQRRTGASLHHLHDLRGRSVAHLADLMDEDPVHSQQSARLSLSLFDLTRDRHELGDDSRELLEAAALLANVGLFVSHAGHHKHSYYVIRNSEHLTGFTDREIEIIAQVARYHRKSTPKPKHTDFSRLPEPDQHRVRVLAGLLRIGIALDRTHQGLVEQLTCDGDDPMCIYVEADEDHDISLELHMAAQRKDLLQEVLSCSVQVERAPQAHPPEES